MARCRVFSFCLSASASSSFRLCLSIASSFSRNDAAKISLKRGGAPSRAANPSISRSSLSFFTFSLLSSESSSALCPALLREAFDVAAKISRREA